jgi:hypothetical protein
MEKDLDYRDGLGMMGREHRLKTAVMFAFSMTTAGAP